MTCAITPNGPCSLAADGGCIIPKTFGSFNPIQISLVTGQTDGFILDWFDNAAYAGQTYELVVYNSSSSEYTRYSGNRDSLAATVTGLTSGQRYQLWIRPVYGTEFGEWSMAQAISDAGWNSSSVEVLFGNEPVFFGTDVVLFS